jgi:hypothetical protein
MWCTALSAVGVLTATAGIAFVLLYDTAVFADGRDGVNAAFWPDTVADPALRRYQHWIHAVLGATMAGWGIAIAALAHWPLRRGEGWAWWTLAASVLTWCVLDTSASAYFGVVYNVQVNIVAALPLIVPLIALRPRGITQ